MRTSDKAACMFAGCDDDLRMFSRQANFVDMYLDNLRQVGTVPQDFFDMGQDVGCAFAIQCGNADGLIWRASDQHPQRTRPGESAFAVASGQGRDRDAVQEMSVYAGERFRGDVAIPRVQRNVERITEAAKIFG